MSAVAMRAMRAGMAHLCGASMRRTIIPIAMCATLGGILGGCALGRDVVDVPMASTGTTPAAAMAGAAPAKIVAVNDKRVFSVKPSDPSMPSLESDKDISNPAITARAFARKRGGFGDALGDIVLPEGHTVADLVRAATKKALEEKGYRVVDESSPDYASAVPVSVDITQLWAWFSPGMFSVSVECKADVTASGGVFAASGPVVIGGYAKTSGMAATDSDFRDTLTQALDQLSARMKDQIKSP